MSDKRFISIKNVYTTHDVEVVGGPALNIARIMFAAQAKFPQALFEIITEKEALLEILWLKVGTGFYVTNPYNIIDDEDRRQLAQANLEYLYERIGLEVDYSVIAIDQENPAKPVIKLHT